MNDYAEHLLLMRKMLKDYEDLLTSKKWREAVLMGPPLTVQLRLLTQTVKIQAEENR